MMIGAVGKARERPRSSAGHAPVRCVRVETVALVAQLVLAAVFAAAAIGKLLDLPGSRRALSGFGVPEGTARIVGTLLPMAELATAIALVLRPSAQWGAFAALALLLAFIGGISNALARGTAPDCHCFGALHSAAAGWSSLARNAALAAPAAFVAARGPGPSITTWAGDRSAAELVAIGAGIAAAILAAVALRTWWANASLRRDLASAREAVAAIPPGLPVGAMAPGFRVPDGASGAVTLESLLARELPVALVFVRAGCGPSEGMLPDLERWRRTLADRVVIGVVGAGSVVRYSAAPQALLRDALEEDADLRHELDELLEVFDAYRLTATPSAVILSPEGTIASTTVDGRPVIEALLRMALAQSAPTDRRVRRPTAA